MLASMKLGVSERACLIGLTTFTAHTIAREMRSEERDFVVVFILEWGEERRRTKCWPESKGNGHVTESDKVGGGRPVLSSAEPLSHRLSF